MTGYLLDQTLSQANDIVPPALLRILRQTAALRAALTFLAVFVYLITQPLGVMPAWSLLVFPVERVLFLILVDSRPLARRMQGWFLPVVLGWLLIAPMWEPAMIAGLFANRGLRSAIVELGIGDVANSMLWLIVPVVLGSWQYGSKGLRVTLSALVAEHILLLPVLWHGGEALHGYVLMSLTRIGMLTLLGYIVTHLVGAQRAEHTALEQAHRQLAKRAATAEQLAESRERNRLARELHDTLAHSLTGLSVQLQALETVMECDPEAATKQLKEAQSTVRAGVIEARRSIQALRSAPLDDLGLSEALRQLCRSQAERLGVEFTVDIAQVTELDPLVEQMVYRVAEEALVNVEKHAAPKRVWVNLQALPDDPFYRGAGRLRLEVRDDGTGFAPEDVPSDRFGLAGMMERAQMLGSSLQVESAPGKGTRVVLMAKLG